VTPRRFGAGAGLGLPQALDVLTDLVRHPVLRASDLELERNVSRRDQHVEDTPDDQVFDLSYKTLWPEHPYGYSILGTRDTVGAMSTSDLKRLHERAYFPANCVIAAAGNVEHDRLLEDLGKLAWFDRATSDVQRATPPVVPIPRGSRTEAATPKTPRRPHRIRHRFGPLRRPAQVRPARAGERVRRRDVEPSVPAHPRGAGARLCDLCLHELLREVGVTVSMSHAAQDRRAGSGGDP